MAKTESSPLLTEWHYAAIEASGGVPGRDRFFVVEDSDPRVSFKRRIASGGVSDGRPHKRGVLLVCVTSDMEFQSFGVSSRAQAQKVIEALRDAWPDL